MYSHCNPVNETFMVIREEITEVSFILQVPKDHIVEEEEVLELSVTSEDPAIVLVDPSTSNISITNIDGKVKLSVVGVESA